jgi:hypothetical protein
MVQPLVGIITKLPLLRAAAYRSAYLSLTARCVWWNTVLSGSCEAFFDVTRTCGKDRRQLKQSGFASIKIRTFDV